MPKKLDLKKQDLKEFYTAKNEPKIVVILISMITLLALVLVLVLFSYNKIKIDPSNGNEDNSLELTSKEDPKNTEVKEVYNSDGVVIQETFITKSKYEPWEEFEPYNFSYINESINRDNQSSEFKDGDLCEVQKRENFRFCEFTTASGDHFYISDDSYIKDAWDGLRGNIQIKKNGCLVWQKNVNPTAPGPRPIGVVNPWKDSVVIEYAAQENSENYMSIIIIDSAGVRDLRDESSYSSVFSPHILSDELFYFSEKSEKVYLMRNGVEIIGYDEVLDPRCCEIAKYRIQSNSETIHFFVNKNDTEWYQVRVQTL